MLLKDLLLCIPSGSVCNIKNPGYEFAMVYITNVLEHRYLNDFMDKEVGRVSAIGADTFEIILVNDEVKYEI